MKKVFVAVCVLCVVLAAGAALAQPRGNNAGRMPQGGKQHEGFGFGCRGGRGPIFTPDMSDEIRAKVVEAEKLRIDLRAVMSTKKIDKEKALALFAQIQKAEQEIEVWKFGRKLEMIEKHNEMMEKHNAMMEEYKAHEEHARKMMRMPETPKD